MQNRVVRIAAGCSVDITLSITQMASYGEIDYLVIDFMMEHGVARMAAARIANSDEGYGPGIIGPDIAKELPRLLARKIKIITNAGGLNPIRCAEELKKLASSMGLAPKIVVVHGDEITDMTSGDWKDMYSGEKVPSQLASANVYLGAVPIAAALAQGADIVISGRVVDSALSLGPLMHEFGWTTEDFELLAVGSMVGHLLECGSQPTGGIHTDWREIDFVNSSFPIAEVSSDGGVIITKVPGSGGRVSFGTIAEQLTYEIGDPQRYFLPDVTLDFSQIVVEELGDDRVRLTGARGYPPTSTYKVCCMEHVGWRAQASTVIGGRDAIEKAEKTANAVIERARIMCRDRNWGEFKSLSFEVIGSGASLGKNGNDVGNSEAVYRLVGDHALKEAAAALLRVNDGVGVSMAPGTAPPLGAEVKQRMKMWSFLVDKDEIIPKLTSDVGTKTVRSRTVAGFSDNLVVPNEPICQADEPNGPIVPLESIAFTRSGDKGDLANIGVIARKAEYLPFIANALTVSAVKEWFKHIFADGERATVHRHEMPGIRALNFVLEAALDGGAVASRRFDNMGKALGQQLIDFPVRVSPAIYEQVRAKIENSRSNQ